MSGADAGGATGSSAGRRFTIGKLRGGLCAYVWDATGAKHRYQLAAQDRTAAEAEALDLWRELNQGGEIGQTVAHLWEAYRLEFPTKRIIQNMEWSGRAILPWFGAYRPDQITTPFVKDYTEKRTKEGRQPGTIWTELGHLRIVLNWAAKTRLIDHAPFIPRPMQPAPKERYLSHGEIVRLLEAPCESHIHLAILLMLSTAARVGALLELTWDRVDLDRRIINLRKADAVTRKGRAIVPITDNLLAALTTARESALTDFVIEWAGKPVGSIKKGFNRTVERAGLEDVTPHVLRHTAAVHMAEAGVPMEEIAQFLGHSSVQTTREIYARFSPDHLRRAASALNFGKLRAVK